MSEILFQPLGDPVAAGDSLEHIADIDPRMTRTHYFDGRLLTAEDLERDQIYLDQRLREVGKVLGQGVIAGLELEYDSFSGLLRLQPGQAVTALGRVLQLSSELLVSLGDRALIAQLNNSKYRHFNRGLYAVVLKYVEVATDIAEVFPTDLASKRGADYALVTESVQLGLVPLPLPLPQQNPLHIRASLMRELLGNGLADALIPEDSVALGIIAIQNDTAQWLDSQLLRQPARPQGGSADQQRDLSRQYEALLADIFTARAGGSLDNHFAARDYFSLLPPVGTVPKDAVDAVNGHQGYFPEHFNVHVAPIRLSDLALIRSESLELPNIDLNSRESIDIVVLAPLANQDYGLYARQLERDYDPGSRRLPQLDLLRLKLYPVQPVHALDTDASVWQHIWDAVADGQLLYVRRPIRAAETAVSGIVLARGSELPEPVEPPPASDDSVPTTPSDPGSVIEDEDSVLLRFINFERLAEVRRPPDDDGMQALRRLVERAGDRAAGVLQANEFLLRVERHYDAVVWPTLQVLIERETLPALLERLQEADERHPAVTGKIVLDSAADSGIEGDLAGRWEELVGQIN
ncbi:hypothetical protein GCM10011348_02840 [Marinobacterium nitratireducens]|uniref:Uncharacterized protein n=1 Tax=Marinobacterium nitratireducens TaxID=518897 RepID=A0A918DPC9_9GAMM|nr:hypothetical protein [Marinobacterium nitratireducens]GGO76200.1 hypothetical protein GCM10011348_02840 [Marinobacterium nitratireducens]